MKKYSIYKLKNDLTIIVCDYSHLNSVYFDLAVKVGSRYESEKNNGISHLVEHLCAKKAMNSLKKHSWIKHYINEKFEAYSMEDRTNYEFSAHKKDLKIGMQFLSEILKNSNISQKDVEVEKKIITEELLMHKNDSIFNCDRLVKKHYYNDNPLRFEVLGNKAGVSKLKRDDVKKFIKKYYQPSNTILTVAGDIDHQKLKKMARSYFSFPPDHLKNKNNFKKFKYTGDNMHIIKQDNQQNYFSFHYPVSNDSAVENVKWEFFIEMLNNYLFYKIKDKLFCYLINVNLRTYDEFIDFYIEASFGPNKTASFYSLLYQSLKNFKKSLNQKDFLYYKNNKLMNMDLEKDDPVEFANMLGWNVLMFGSGQALSLTDQQKIIESISLEDIRFYFDQLFADKKGMITVFGKISNAEEKKIKKQWRNWKI